MTESQTGFRRAGATASDATCTQDMTRLTLAIVGRTLFDADVEGEAREIGEALNVALEAVNTLTFPFGHVWERLPLPGPRRSARRPPGSTRRSTASSPIGAREASRARISSPCSYGRETRPGARACPIGRCATRR